jgi:hypothetical protein
VEVSAETKIQSPWMAETCWIPAQLEGRFGTFDWRVRVRTSDGVLSDWSARNAFSIFLDDQPPLVSVLSPQPGEKHHDQLFIEAQTTDSGSGVRAVTLLAWYDDGSQNGYQWHTLGGMQPIGSDVYQFIWDTSSITPQGIQIWVYVEDEANNFGYGRVGNLQLAVAAEPSIEDYLKSEEEAVSSRRPVE